MDGDEPVKKSLEEMFGDPTKESLVRKIQLYCELVKLIYCERELL